MTATYATHRPGRGAFDGFWSGPLVSGTMPTRDRDGLATEELFLLWAARRTGVLDALTSSAGTPAAVAEETGVTVTAATVTVRALADLGFLKRVGDQYEVTNRALGFLAKRDVRSVGRLPHALDAMEYLVALPETMRTGNPPARPDDWTRDRLGAHAATDEAVVRACVTAAIRELPEASSALVLAGGSGVYAVELAARGVDVTMVDEPEALAVVEPLLERSPVTLDDRSLATLAASASFDLVFGVDVCTAMTAAEAAATAATSPDLLDDGGAVVLAECVRDRSAESTIVAARELAFARGSVHGADDYLSWFEDAGLVDADVREIPGTSRQAAVGRKRTVD